MTAARLLPLAALLLAGGLAIWRASTNPPAPFVPPAPHTARAEAATLERAMLPRFGQPTGGASLAMLPDGRLAAAWQGSLDNGDEALWFSTRGAGGWNTPVVAALRESSAAGSLARIGGLGRPLLQVEGSQLALWYASNVFAGQPEGALYHGLSTDSGKSWQNARRQAIGPLAALGGTPTGWVALADGGFLLAVSEPGLLEPGTALRFDGTGRLRGKTRLPAAPRALAVLDAQRATIVGGEKGRLHALATRDGGAQWQIEGELPAELADQPAALLRLNDGRLLLAANKGDRRHLALWLSQDAGLHWQNGQEIEAADDGNAEFAFPSLVQTRDDRIHLIYTWRRQGIRHLNFSPAWLAGETS